MYGHNGKDDPEDLPPPRAAGDRTDPWLDATPRPEPLPPVHFFPFFLATRLAGAWPTSAGSTSLTV